MDDTSYPREQDMNAYPTDMGSPVYHNNSNFGSSMNGSDPFYLHGNKGRNGGYPTQPIPTPLSNNVNVLRSPRFDRFSPAHVDQQRAWDMSQLQNKLSDMQLVVYATEEALTTKSHLHSNGPPNYNNPGAFYQTLNSMNGTAGQGIIRKPMGALPVDIVPLHVDRNQCKILSGRVYKKGGEANSFPGRNWKERYLKLEGIDLVFYEKQGSSVVKDTFSINGSVTVTSRPPRGKGRLEFDVTNTQTNESRTIYCDSDSDAQAWIDTITYITGVCNRLMAEEYAGQGGSSGGTELVDNFQVIDGILANLQNNSPTMNDKGDFVNPDITELMRNNPAEIENMKDEAQMHQCYGSGLYEGSRGEPAACIIQAYDVNGEPKRMGGDTFLVSLESEKYPDLRFDLVPVDNGDGTYYIEYTPTRTGEWNLHVLYNGFDIYGSPFTPIISPAPTAASHCLVSGPGLTEAHLTSVNTFTITARDMYDDLRNVGGDDFELLLVGPGLANPIVDNGDGTYTVSYDVDLEHQSLINHVPGEEPPRLEIHVALNNPGFPYPRPIKGSPFLPEIIMDEDDGLLAAALLVEAEAGGLDISLVEQVAEKVKEAGAEYMAERARSNSVLVGAANALSSLEVAHNSDTSRPEAENVPLDDNSTAMNISTNNYNYSSTPQASSRSSLDDEVFRLKQQLLQKEKEMDETLAQLQRDRANLEMSKTQVDAQMTRMAELGRKVKEDSEKLAEQARLLREKGLQASSHRVNNNSPSQVNSKTSGTLNPTLSPFTSTSIQDSKQDAPQRSESPTNTVYSRNTLSTLDDNQSLYNFDPTLVAAYRSQLVQSTPSAPAAAPAPAATPASASGELNLALESVICPTEIFSPEAIALFEEQKRPLYALWADYASRSRSAEGTHSRRADGIDLKRFVQLFFDFDVSPTFLSKKELKAIYLAVTVAHGTNSGSEMNVFAPVSYAAFVEALGRCAIVGLSKPAFANLYPTVLDKIRVLLRTWNIADPAKLAEVQAAQGYKQKSRSRSQSKSNY